MNNRTLLSLELLLILVVDLLESSCFMGCHHFIEFLDLFYLIWTLSATIHKPANVNNRIFMHAILSPRVTQRRRSCACDSSLIHLHQHLHPHTQRISTGTAQVNSGSRVRRLCSTCTWRKELKEIHLGSTF